MDTVQSKSSTQLTAQIKTRVELIEKIDSTILRYVHTQKQQPADQKHELTATTSQEEIVLTPTDLLQTEISELMQRTQQIIARLGIKEEAEFTKKTNAIHHCILSWSNYKDPVTGKPITAEATATTRRCAKVLCRIKLLELSRIELPLSNEDRSKAREIQRYLDTDQLHNAVNVCVDLILHSPPEAWSLILPNVWKAVLASYKFSYAEDLVNAIRQASIEGRHLSVFLWENIIDLCTVLSNGKFGYEALALLTDGVKYDYRDQVITSFNPETSHPLQLDESVFPSKEICDYFQRFRTMLAFELRMDFSHRAESCRFEDEASSSETGPIHLNVSGGLLNNNTVLRLHTTSKTSIVRFLHRVNVREDDLVLLRPNEPVLDEKSSWKQAFAVRISSIDVKGNRLELSVKLVTDEHLSGVLENKSFILYPLATSVGYRRMCTALKLLCLSRWPLTEKKPTSMFSPAMRFILLYSTLPETFHVAERDSIPLKYSELFEVTYHTGKTKGSPLAEREDPFLLLSYNEAEALIKKLPLEHLTAAQHCAVRSSLINRLTLIQGPPGTGKTYTACCIIEAWCKAHPKKRILAVADSNIAADNLSDGLKEREIKNARVGAGTEMDIYEDNARVHQDESFYYELEFSKTKAQKYEKWKFSRHLLLNNQVIITTCIGSGHPLFDGLQFECVVIDECAQSTEPANLVALSRNCSNLVLIGDVNQLAATIISHEAYSRGLHISLLKRLTMAQICDVILLNIQRRMHPSIAEFPNFQFYDGSIRNQDVNDHTRPPIAGFIFPNPAIRVCLIKVEPKSGSSTGFESAELPSRYNTAEAHLIPLILASIFERNCIQHKNIGVLTPYDAQKRYIKQLLSSKYSKDILKQLEVDTIDGFQGKEKDLIIFSAVRSNVTGDLGFVVDARRMNVMLTRARRGLIIIADPLTLKSETINWAVWLDWIVTRKAVISSDNLRSYLSLCHPEPFKAKELSRAVLTGQVKSPWNNQLVKTASASYNNTNTGTSKNNMIEDEEDDGWD